MNEFIKTSVTPADLAEALKKTGYRANLVEHERVPQLQSAAQGIGFFIAFGNPAPASVVAAGRGGYVDFSFQCWFAIQGELRADLVESWNRSKRFARLFQQKQMLVLAMDVMVAGGVCDAFLCAQVEVWDRVMHDFIAHFKQPAPATAG
jgi:hypothetical protein